MIITQENGKNFVVLKLRGTVGVGEAVVFEERQAVSSLAFCGGL